MLVEIGNIIFHLFPWLAALAYKLGIVSEGLHDMFCTYGCETMEFAL